jgi:DUF438 domain-containing protein
VEQQGSQPVAVYWSADDSPSEALQEVLSIVSAIASCFVLQEDRTIKRHLQIVILKEKASIS